VLVWKKKRLDRMLVDHCLRQGFYETAKKLSLDADIEVQINHCVKPGSHEQHKMPVQTLAFVFYFFTL